MSAATWIGVGVLGALGACGRFGLDGLVERRSGPGYPLGTLVVNLTGAFAPGVLAGAGVSGTAEILAGGAFLGGYTAFSTWMFESARLAEDGELRQAALKPRRQPGARPGCRRRRLRDRVAAVSRGL
jgi:CrcB protein